MSARLVAVPVMGMKAALQRLVDNPQSLSKIARTFHETGFISGQSHVVLYPHLVGVTDLARVEMEDLYEIASAGMKEALKGDLIGEAALPRLRKMTRHQAQSDDPENILVNEVVLGVEVAFTPDKTMAAPGVLDLLRLEADDMDDGQEDDAVSRAAAEWHSAVHPCLNEPMKVMSPLPWPGLRAALVLSNVSTCLGLSLSQQKREIRSQECEVSLHAEDMIFRLHFSHEGQHITDVRFHHALIGNELSEFVEHLARNYRYQGHEVSASPAHV